MEKCFIYLYEAYDVIVGGQSDSHLSKTQTDRTDKCNGKRAKQKRYLVQQSIWYLLFHQLGDKTYDRRLVIYDALYLQILPTYVLRLVTEVFSCISVMTMFSPNLVSVEITLLDCTWQVQLCLYISLTEKYTSS